MKRAFFYMFKILLGVGLLYFLWSRGQIDFKLIGKAMQQPGWVVSIFLQFSTILLVVARWRFLLRAVGIISPYRKALRYFLYGTLTTLVTPGALGGDLLRAGLLVKSTPHARYTAALSVAIDRYIGIMALFTAASFAFLFRPAHLLGNPVLTSLGLLVIGGAIGLPILLVIGSSPHLSGLLKRFLPWIFQRGFGHSILESLHQYRQKPLVLLTCYLMSLFIQIVAI